MPELTIPQALELAMRRHVAGDLAGAEQIYRAILQVAPQHFDACNNLAVALQQQGRPSEAETASRRALEIDPNSPDALNNLGENLRGQRRLDEAMALLTRALELRPGAADILYNLGNTFGDAGRFDEAAARYRRALEIDPNHAKSHLNLGTALVAVDDYAGGIAHLRRAVELDPSNPSPINNLGYAVQKQGRIEEAIAMYHRAAELAVPAEAPPHLSNALLALHYRAEIDPAATADAHRQFGARLANLPPVSTRRTVPPGRRLRIAYLSPDLYQHSVAFFLEPILAHRDRSAFETIIYSDTAKLDAVTDRLRGYVDGWHDVRGLPDQALARRIAADEIDILIDLAGHTAGNRMGVFARRAAPVQVSYLGYPNTTGLPAMDYRITDAVADPPGEATDRLYTEKLLRLPRCAWCYQPSPLAPPVAPPPAEKNGFVTFGCFNALPKMNDPLLRLWAKMVLAVPGSRLKLKAPGLKSAEAAARVRGVLLAAGVPAERFDLLAPVHPYADHLASYGRVDIALDTFPYNGTTTTCDALWMGVPVLTRAGSIHVSRVGASLLAAAGLDDWVTTTEDDYVARARRAAADVAALAALRSTLREQMAASPLCDGASMARAIERALREAREATLTGSPS